jgi:protein-L-isoaspartate(D-aspartate) O-methyltransferase
MKAASRKTWIFEQLERRGIDDRRVLDAISSIPREAFVPEDLKPHAYDDAPLPIGEGQTISQPLMVATMLQELKLAGGERVMEIGSGSGYVVALLAALTSRVYGIERHHSLVQASRKALASLGIENAEIIEGDGSKGLPGKAPFDAILISCAVPQLPLSLREQLKDGGRMVLPVGPRRTIQELVRVTRFGDDYHEEELGGVAFVPLIGEAGW